MANFTITWYGKGATPYTFECYPDGQEFNPVSGVYIFCRSIIGDAVHCGSSVSIKPGCR